jgi:predicted RNA-binding protein YlxR (DUF448 family)
LAAELKGKRKSRRQGPRPRHVPERTCVGCGAVDAKRGYVRLVRTPEGIVEVDPSGKRNGRGAYLHPTRRCWRAALDSGAVARALKIELDDAVRERLWTYARTHFPPDVPGLSGADVPGLSGADEDQAR